MSLPSISSNSSRRHSISSKFKYGENEEHNISSGNQKDARPFDIHSEDFHQSADGDSSHNENIPPPRYLSYTKNHPLGRLFLALFRENVKLAKNKDLDINLHELCTDFYKGMQLEKGTAQRTAQAAAEEMEKGRLDRELNAHTIGLSFNPPTHFSKSPTWVSVHHKSECMKIFPTKYKFGGVSKDGSMDIIEFLNAVNLAQADCKTSEKEFKVMLMACTTGKPHALLMEWLANNDDIPTIYHNLLLHFDRRISPEAARHQLMVYKAPKNATLASAEAHIMSLANRAASLLPPGPSRSAAYNLDSVLTLIKCLPIRSADIVQTRYNELTARQGYAATAAQLSRMLFTSRHIIDRDIAENGADIVYDTSSSSDDDSEDDDTGISAPVYTVSQSNSELDNGQDVSGTSRLNIEESVSRDNSAGTENTEDGKNKSSRSRKARRPKTGESKSSVPSGPKSWDRKESSSSSCKPGFCCLCGQNTHVSSMGCPNMVDDDGNIIKYFPTFDTCPDCPKNVTYRLNHNRKYCPFREGGPLVHA
jgi:hypothetical protein